MGGPSIVPDPVSDLWWIGGAAVFNPNSVDTLVQRLFAGGTRYVDGVVRDQRTGLGTYRPALTGAGYHFDGVNDELRLTTADVGTLYVSYYNHTTEAWVDTSVTHGGAYYSFVPPAEAVVQSIKVWTDNTATTEQKQSYTTALPANVHSWLLCEDSHDSSAYDSSGNGNHWTKAGHTTGTGAGTFHYRGYINFSAANTYGYSEGTGEPIPANLSTLPSAPTHDVLGTALDYTGTAYNNGQLNDAFGPTFNGTTGYANTDSDIVLPVDGVASWSVRCRYYKPTNNTRMLIGQHNTAGNRIYFTQTPTNSIRVSLNDSKYVDFSFPWRDAGNQSAWKELTFAYAADTFTLQVDGVVYPEAGTGNYSGDNTNFTVNNIGNPFTGTSFTWDGSWCDFEVTLNGTVVGSWAGAEGVGGIHYDRSGNGNNLTVFNETTTAAGAYWATLQQSVYHANYADGCSLYTHATLGPLRVPYGLGGNPLSITPPSGYTLARHHPPTGYNMPESTVDLTGGVSAPGAESLAAETAWPGDDLTNPLFSRKATDTGLDGGNPIYRDRVLCYEDTIPAGDDLDNITAYVATVEA